MESTFMFSTCKVLYFSTSLMGKKFIVVFDAKGNFFRTHCNIYDLKLCTNLEI